MIFVECLERGSSLTEDAGAVFVRTHLAKLHAVHVLLQHRPGHGAAYRRDTASPDLDRPAAARTLRPTIREAVERYLRIRLEAKFDRPQTVRLAREGLRRFVGWLTRWHPEITTLAQVDRSLMEEYLRWLPGCLSKHTGEPLAVTTVKHEVNAIGAFCRDTAIWGWTDVPGRPLISSRDTPRRPETLPRYLTTQEVDALMGAVEDLTHPLQRAALLLLRWSGEPDGTRSGASPSTAPTTTQTDIHGSGSRSARATPNESSHSTPTPQPPSRKLSRAPRHRTRWPGATRPPAKS